MFRNLVIVWLICQSTICFAQNSEEKSYADQLLALEQELDSLSIFNILDSVLLQTDFQTNQLNIRFGMTSSVTSAGRDYNINQTGYSSGISFFHKSGLYSDLSGYWNSDVTPTYNPTILSGGYLGAFSPKWSYSLDYEHWFFNPKDSSDNALTNSLGASLSYDFKKGYIGIDYSYLFGKETSQRIITNFTGTINLGKWGKFKNITLFPTVSMMAGHGNVTTLRITSEQLSRREIFYINKLDSLSQLSDQQLEQLLRSVGMAYRNGNITETRRDELINIILTASVITDEELAELNDLATNGVQQEEFVDGEEFGILNYSFSIPLSFSSDRISILVNYTYSIPVKLSSEFFDVEPVGYFGASISYRIPY
jgi:hypothetical protein